MIHGRSWTLHEGLHVLNDTNPCVFPSWAHISCDCSGQVNNLDLKNAKLVGKLPASFIDKLGVLEGLSLHNNFLLGPLSSFRGMAALRHAFLNGNSFEAILADFFDSWAIRVDNLPSL